MSQETLTWLGENTLIGFTEKRGNAWHYRQGNNNHYVGAVPVEDIIRRLFHWKAIEGSVQSSYTLLNEDGVETVTVTDPERKAIVRPDTGQILGVFKGQYQIHDYEQWLINNIAVLLDGGLSIGSAGLLKKGGVAWVQVELSDNRTTPEGVTFRPFLSGATSLDGSLSSTYTAGSQLIVCDNTLSAALGDKGALQVKIKHSSKSLQRVGEVREALELVETVGDDFAAEVKALCEIEVPDSTWSQFLDAHVVDAKGRKLTDLDQGRGRTILENKRAELSQLWAHDERVSPWKNTGFGVVQAVNTWTHHKQGVRGGDGGRAERNLERTVLGKVDDLDNGTLSTLNKVLARI